MANRSHCRHLFVPLSLCHIPNVLFCDNIQVCGLKNVLLSVSSFYCKHKATVLSRVLTLLLRGLRKNIKTLVTQERKQNRTASPKQRSLLALLFFFIAVCKDLLSPSSTAVVTLQLGPVRASGQRSCQLIKMHNNCWGVSL